MAKENKKTKRSSSEEFLQRLENAYQEWKLGKSKSDKELAKKYNVHPQNLSRYITFRIETNKK